MTLSTTGSLQQIREKVERGERISAADGEHLFDPGVDLHAVGHLADSARRRRHGPRTYYNLNAHINPTNICIYRCALCAYSRDADDPTAYVLSEEEILARAAEAHAAGCTELHVVGGVHPEKPYSWYRGLLAAIHAAYPRLHLKAFTAVEIAWFAQLTGRSFEAILDDLREAGLGSLPGGGAEVFDPQVRNQISPRKANAQTWLAVHRAAHGLGIRSNASMLFGHLESIDHRIEHLVALRRLQDETGGFMAFIPLVFHPENTRLSYLEKPSSLDALRTLAVSRLMLDNFDHVKAYWVTLGVGVAQTALGYGADDLDGTVSREAIHHEAGAESPQLLSLTRIRALIREAGLEPIERDSLYRPLPPAG